MQVDKRYCMSSFLMYRIISDRSKCFSEKYPPKWDTYPADRESIHNSCELHDYIEQQMKTITTQYRCGLALSGGIDSAILLKFMPEGSKIYTFKCLVPGVEVTDESTRAKEYLKTRSGSGMKHDIVPIYWEDMESMSTSLMKQKGAPIHSIEVQIYKAALQAKADGCEVLIFGETADCIYGGHSNLLAQDWTLGDFISRWSFLLPHRALKEFEMDITPFMPYERNGYMDVLPFLSEYEAPASWNSYVNACDLAEINFFSPYASTIMDTPLDLERVRKGENKYLVREVFQKLYPDFEIPPKTPMPRPMNEWLKDWEGPVRSEFWPHCTDTMTADQKWLVYSLERFLNIIDEE